MNNKVAVLGAGSWGTALSVVLAHNGYDVNIWSRNKTIIQDVNEKHENVFYLPSFYLPETIVGKNTIEEAVEGAGMVLVVIPSHAMRETAQLLKPFLKKNMLLIHATKGLEASTSKTMSQVLSEELPDYESDKIAVISGPSHAEEVIRKFPTTVVVSSKDLDTAKKLLPYFHNDFFRVYTNSDMLGVELGGALKNIIALAAGISDGIGYGDNTKAALFTRGLAEMTRLGVSMGAKQETFLGLAGVGDLMVTCSSQLSRNWRTGYRLGRGEPLHLILNSMGMVVEGVKSTRVAMELSEKFNVDMPLTQCLYDILFNQIHPDIAKDRLMKRLYKEEL